MVILARISWIRERIATGSGVSFSCSYSPSPSTHKVTVRAYHAQSLQHINFLADSFLASTADLLGDLVSSDKGHRHSSDVSVIILYFRRRGVQTFAAGEDESNSEGFTENRGDTSDSWFNSWGSTNGQPSSWYHAPQQQVLVEQQDVLADQRNEIVEQKRTGRTAKGCGRAEEEAGREEGAGRAADGSGQAAGASRAEGPRAAKGPRRRRPESSASARSEDVQLHQDTGAPQSRAAEGAG
eukprot:TRINITY_DN16429_c0_g1_i4.p1 TRINITY_DN16429_c0_g1~~TRINITY_DN16429_c0_g1_i4.p1  ORF type:complete len:240 (+),score=41.72 TRINITY_DN16429_c0_g1_i4:124-843(+)